MNMNKKLVGIISILIILVILILIGLISIFKENPTIPFESAKAIAEERVAALNPPFEWVYVDSSLVYDYKGNPGRYYFFFVKKDVNITISSFEDLPKLIPDVDQCYIDNYCTHNFATISIRAYERPTGRGDRNLYGVTRHYRGPPSFMMDRLQVEQAVLAKYPTKKFGREIVILDSTFEPVYYTLIDKDEEITYGSLSKDTEIIKRGTQDDFYIVTIDEVLTGNKKITKEMEGAMWA